MLLATTSALVALASVASQVAASSQVTIVSPKPFPARVQADSTFTIKISHPTDTRTAAEKAESSTPIDFTKMSYYQTMGCLQEEIPLDLPEYKCIDRWVAADPVKNVRDITELSAKVPVPSERLVVGGRYYIQFFSFCSFDESKYDVCDFRSLQERCFPCDGNNDSQYFETETFEVVPKGAEDDVPDANKSESDSAASSTSAVSSVAAAVVAVAMAIGA